jgi:hypothetical protein
VSETIPEIVEREQEFTRMLANPSTADEAQAGLEAAREQRFEGVANAPRTLGFGVIRADEPVDGLHFLVAVTDGSRDAAVSVTLAGTLVAVLGARGEDPAWHLIDRISRDAGEFKVDRRYEEILLHHPFVFTA